MRLVPLQKKILRKYMKIACSWSEKACEELSEHKSGFKVEGDNFTLVILGGKPYLVLFGDQLLPTLFFVKKCGINCLNYVVVDEGATKFILKGADVMVPGITRLGEFGRGEVVSVWKHDLTSPLAVGISLMSSDEIRESSRGKAVKNLHYAGDKVWKLMIQVLRGT